MVNRQYEDKEVRTIHKYRCIPLQKNPKTNCFMSFFDSEMLRAEMVEINELQEEVYSNVFKFPSMNPKEQLRHIELLEKLIDKQKILYFRLSLTDDPDAKKMQERIRESAELMGIPKTVGINALFDQMQTSISIMKKHIDKNEFPV